ncbi:type I glyceraldehyde-3-phosphate dehydrogenase [bacterium SCSIO 12696]|nr:type I glyceraldehyde-3-phosphate dehydrogenase [bacterium SCSIO 12696]
MIRVAINGFGRIGRNVLRACYEGGYCDRIQIVAINDLGSPEVNAHLLRHDTVHGDFGPSIAVTKQGLLVDGDTIQVFAKRDPAELPWEDLQIDVAMECTGLFTKRADASKHLAAGAKRVLVSAPGTDLDATIVHGVNHHILSKKHRLISNASCTTNCLAPIAQVLHNTVGIESGLANTVHAYTNDQVLNDTYHTDLRRARSATQSMIPSKTGAAAAIGEVIPELCGKLDGLSVRVPVINTSLLDLTFKASKTTSVEEINRSVEEAVCGEIGSVLTINDLPLVSSDFNHNPASSIFDKTQTKVIADQVKILAWYDNEWGFSNRMLDNALVIGTL